MTADEVKPPENVRRHFREKYNHCYFTGGYCCDQKEAGPTSVSDDTAITLRTIKNRRTNPASIVINLLSEVCSFIF